MLRIGHRGAAGTAPENTLASFRRAVTLGVDGVELDVQRSRDGALVVIHDETVDRTTDGSGRVANLTLAEIGRLDAGTWKGPEFAGERVPTLAEVVEAVPAPVRVFVELKDPSRYPGIEAEVVGLVRERGVGDRVELSSFDHASLARVRSIAPEVRLGFLYSRHPDPIPAARALRAASLHAAFRHLASRVVDDAHRAGLAVYAWTLNEPADIAAARAMGVDGIFSDRPERLISGS